MGDPTIKASCHDLPVRGGREKDWAASLNDGIPYYLTLTPSRKASPKRSIEARRQACARRGHIAGDNWAGRLPIPAPLPGCTFPPVMVLAGSGWPSAEAHGHLPQAGGGSGQVNWDSSYKRVGK